MKTIFDYLKSISIYSFLFFIISSCLNFGQIPSTISYQGVITDNIGNPLTGTFSMQFGLYTTSTNGSAVWTESQTVQVNNGLFNVLLGESNPLSSSIIFNVPYWLQVTVNNSSLPRTKLSSSAYSFNASRIQGQAFSSSNPSIGQVLKWTGSQWAAGTDDTGSTISGNAGGDLIGTYPNPTVVKILGRPLSSVVPSSGQVLKWTGSDWKPGNDETGGMTLPYSATSSSINPFYIQSNNSNGNAISGTSTGSSGTGVSGIATNTSNSGATGVYGETSSDGGAGVYGKSRNNNRGSGIFGMSGGNNGNGVEGYVTANSSGASAIYGHSDYSSAYAGYFWGKVHISGTLSKSGGSFEIDDPIDPANKILRHSFVESPDMMNVYNGNITTDRNGKATVELPGYFEALNMDFRYQLTVIGQFAQAIVSEEIQNNHFSITTDKPNIKVSWQVTGIRKDPWAEKNRIIVEEQKSSQIKGFYLNPGAYGLPQSRGVEYILHPEIKNQLQKKSQSPEIGR